MKMRHATRTRTAARLIFGALLSLWASGCGGGHGEEGCPELCEQQAACPGAAITEEKCISDCQSQQEYAEKNECSEALTELLECQSHAEDVCDAEALSDECTIQSQAYVACLPKS